MGMGFITPTGLRMDIACATGFVVETGLFCTYTCLFIAALPALTSARRLKDARSVNSAWVFLILSILMYLVATIHLIFSGIRFYKGIFLHSDVDGRISYFNDYQPEFLWVFLAPCIQTWLGDALVIYRCYFVWNNSLWVIAVPLCLLLATLGINASTLYAFRHPSNISRKSLIRLLNSIYPLAFAENFMTTGFIILRIFLQYRASKEAGVVDVGSKLSLILIIRIVVESAALYTIQVLVLTILYFLGDNFQFVVQPAVLPSIGITFVLLALRIEASRHESPASENDFGIRSSMIPQWLRDPDDETGPEESQSGSSLPAADNIEETEQKWGK